MSKTNKNTMDMTHGTLWNKILIFALPLAASSILQQLFNSIDTAVVGRFASSQALAAVGSNSSLIALMINLFIGISLGSNVVIAHYIGQRSEKNSGGNSYGYCGRLGERHFCYDIRTVYCKAGIKPYGDTG